MTEFQKYWRDLSPEAKQELARDASTSVNLLSQQANGHKPIGLNTMVRLCLAREEINVAMLKPGADFEIVAHG